MNSAGDIKGKPDFLKVDFDQSPFIVIWEVTQACDLACVHCRASAQSYRSPLELSFDEGRELIDQICEFGSPLLVLTGGDPIKRPDVYDLIKYACDRGLRIAMTPSGTPLMTREVVAQLKDAGLSRLAVSLDGSTADLHDHFRQVPGSFQWTVDAIEYAHEVGLPVQVNTTMTQYNFEDFPNLIQKMIELDIVLWSVFFLVPTGRGQADDELTAEEYEWVLTRLYEVSRSVSFDIKTTAAPHYRRVVLQQAKADGTLGDVKRGGNIGFHVGGDAIGRAAKGVNDGRGFVFVSHLGQIFPSGFLPVSAGNVRKDRLVDVYRKSDLFTALRDPEQLKGKCGLCEYKTVCGGCRARAYAVTGDFLESDPYCVYVSKRAEEEI
ncbi:MAG: TIGR04053 family radical SAM/SPASM domain-containing protein, partial [Candidatus Latescibacteria bacterium]|nr:TIGR04053 family radical SAM/SPASM domain-containing protein [Candidatus Latescibacterota bacterium]